MKARGWQLLITGLALLLAQLAMAGVPKPDIPEPEGKGEQCVEDEDVMRVNHMEFILHQRDETMHQGIRTKKHSLKECINCHAVKGDDGQPVGIDSPKHFCRVCHNYAAVSIDCFQCHNSKPELNSDPEPEATSDSMPEPESESMSEH